VARSPKPHANCAMAKRPCVPLCSRQVREPRA
jgi:hypothetical protein